MKWVYQIETCAKQMNASVLGHAGYLYYVILDNKTDWYIKSSEKQIRLYHDKCFSTICKVDEFVSSAGIKLRSTL